MQSGTVLKSVASKSIVAVDGPDEWDARKIDIRAVLASPPPPMDWVMQGLLSGTVGGVVGAGGVGKSFLHLQIAIGIATGIDPTGGGLPAIGGRGKVAYLCGEDPAAVLWNRLYPMGQKLHASTREDMLSNFDLFALHGKKLDIMQASVAKLVERCARGCRLLIIDTLRKFHSGDENDNGVMAGVLGRLEAIAESTGACVLFVHHVAKGGATPRGASAITDNSRWIAFLRGMTPAEAESAGTGHPHRFAHLSVTKGNYSPQPHAEWLYRDPDAGGGFERVDPIFSSTPTKGHTKGRKNVPCHKNGY